MTKKIVLIFLAFILLFLAGLISCDEKNNCGPFPNKFKTVGLDWNIYEANYSETADSRLLLSDIDGDSIDYDTYSIHIRTIQETYFAQHNNWGFSLMNSAYACSPKEPETDEKIDSIVILSTKNFDINHPSGTDLAVLFDIVILDYANNIYFEKYTLNDYLSAHPSVPSELTLMLREQPDLITDFEFLVKYYQNGIDFNYFEFLTTSIVLK